MKCIHFGDLHVWKWRFDFSDPFYPKRWLGFVNLGLRRRHHFPPELGERVMAHIAEQDADAVFCTGDFSTMSLDEEYARAVELMEPLEHKWKDRLFVIPGNHDRYSPRSQHRYDKWFPQHTIDQVRSWEIEEDLVIVAVDASRPFKVRSNGELTDEVESKLDAELTKFQGQKVILMGHYPYHNLEGYPETWDHMLLGEERFQALVAKHRPILYLHGHKHVRWELRPEKTPDTLCLNCGSAGMASSKDIRQAGYVTFEINEGSVENVEFVVIR